MNSKVPARNAPPYNLLIGSTLTLLFLAIALISYVWTPFDIENLNIANRLKTPSLLHWLGTDHYGRDILSMIMVGARTSIAVALIAVGIGILLGVPFGLFAAASRGSMIDEIIMRGNDLVFAFPALLIAIMITAVFGPGAVNAIIAIGIFNIPVFARLTRGAALSQWTRDYVLAARIAGKNALRISIEHILPNILNLLIVQGTIQFSLGVLAEAWCPAADPELGSNAGGQSDNDQLCPTSGIFSWLRHPANGSRVKSDG